MTNDKRRQRWVDWAGCACTVLFAVVLWRRNTAMGVLLAPMMAYEVVMAASFLLRRAPRAKDGSATARVAAYGVTALVPAYFAFAPTLLAWTPPFVVRVAGGLIWLTSCVLALWAMWTIRYSFSIEPQARSLVQTGPYRWVRHPLYACYGLQYAAILLRAPSAGFAMILVAWFLMLAARMKFEERVLGAAFPEYTAYRQRAGALVPRFRRPGRSRAAVATVEFIPMEVQ